MIGFRSLYFSLAGHEIHVTEWGDPASPALVMAHGLVRQGRDFDTAAARLAERFRVLCPDTIGRGLSSWSAAPERDYTLSGYVHLAASLLDALGVAICAWVGTSMGGLIGMAAAAGPLRGRIARLVLNDIGPVIDPAAVERIRTYGGHIPDFDGVVAYEAFLRRVYAPFGALTDAEWRRMAETSARRRDDGRITVHYDPRIVQVFAQAGQTPDLWEAYDGLACPVLVLRGAESDMLTPEVAGAMTRRGPRAGLVTVPGCGHAPALNVPSQLDVVERFLEGGW
ncbi:MAG: alpha/beta hydrolase [Magnetospirillum sp.]|nr:alpha/beta hydrolase [Magnetospirillum sp.]